MATSSLVIHARLSIRQEALPAIQGGLLRKY